jgi:hypothetical protein
MAAFGTALASSDRPFDANNAVIPADAGIQNHGRSRLAKLTRQLS